MNSNAFCGEPIFARTNPTAGHILDSHVLRRLEPSFFGFNVELIEFQRTLWSSASSSVDSAGITLLQSFPGAVYRYPGGTPSNHLDWTASIGEMPLRQKQRVVEYENAAAVSFGIEEYLRFVDRVGGRPWFVANLFGSFTGSIEPSKMEGSFRDLVATLNSPRYAGLPPIFRWELGNELDRGRYGWTLSEYIGVARRFGRIVSERSGKGYVVSMLKDWKHVGSVESSVNFNEGVSSALSEFGNDFATHIYFDGHPWGPPIHRVIGNLCENIQSLLRANSASSIWITELGRAPTGTPNDKNWRSNWTQTSNFDAALGTAQIFIELAKLPRVKGIFLHSLHAGVGPWPTFSRSTSTGDLRPTPVFLALSLFRRSMLPNLLVNPTHLKTTSDERLQEPSLAVMSTESGSRISIWFVNRKSTDISAQIVLPPLARNKYTGSIQFITRDHNEKNPEFPTQERSLEAAFSASGDLRIMLPPQSIGSAVLQIDR